MVLDQSVQVQDESFEDALTNYEQSCHDEGLARQTLDDALRRREQLLHLAERARKMEEETRAKEDQAWRAAEEARRREEGARREGQTQGRWETEARRWESRASELAREANRREAETRSHAQRAQVDVHKVTHEHARMQRMAGQAQRMADDARSRQTDAERRAREARRKGQDAQDEARSLTTWEADVQRWDAETLRCGWQIGIYKDERRRYEREVRSVAAKVQELEEEVEKRVQRTQYCKQRIDSLEQCGRAKDSPLESGSPPLTVTNGATAYLKTVLDGLEHEPEQMLRLTAGPEGEIIVELDFKNECDRVICWEKTEVLLVGFPLPEGLLGRTLAIKESPGGKELTVFP